MSPIWSPDGTRIAATHWIIDVTRPPSEDAAGALPAPGEGLTFIASSWTRDSRSLAGDVIRATDGTSSGGLWSFSLDTGRYRKIRDDGFNPVLLSDGRRLLFWPTLGAAAGPPQGVSRLDITTSRVKRVLSDLPIGFGNYSLSLSKDDRRLAYVETVREGDVWLMTLGPPTTPK